MQKRRATGFTLVELLVVIGIIALLISILLPAITRARARAVQTQCLSNLHQLAMGAYNYSVDHHGQVIWTVDTQVYTSTNPVTDTINGVTGPVSYSWNYERVQNGGSQYSFDKGPIAPYVKTQAFLVCPSMRDLALKNLGGALPTTYAVVPTNESVPLVTKMSQFSIASETVFFADAVFVNTTTGALGTTANLHRPSFGAPYVGDTFYGVHLGGYGNVGYCDGHAASVLAKVRPANLQPSPAAYAVIQANHIGLCYPGAVDFSTLTSSSYPAYCKSTLDYPFWADKRNPGS